MEADADERAGIPVGSACRVEAGLRPGRGFMRMPGYACAQPAPIVARILYLQVQVRFRRSHQQPEKNEMLDGCRLCFPSSTDWYISVSSVQTPALQ